MATGVLALCLGAATRLSRFLTSGPKAYAGRIALGVETDTYDADGRVVSTGSVAGVDLARARRAAAGLSGDILQVPPLWSAKWIAGRRAYALAREGRREPPPSCLVRVDRFEILGLDGSRLLFEVECSSGTYVRSLANDLGRALGCGAHLEELRRTRSGPFVIEQAHALDAVRAAARAGRLRDLVLPLEEVDLGLETARLTATGVHHALTGRRLGPAELVEPPSGGAGAVRLIDPAGRLVGIAEPVAGAAGTLQPRVVLAARTAERPGRAARVPASAPQDRGSA
jgi:tRNA pseudouridine55 synthase